jgi:hypothetical protein
MIDWCDQTDGKSQMINFLNLNVCFCINLNLNLILIKTRLTILHSLGNAEHKIINIHVFEWPIFFLIWTKNMLFQFKILTLNLKIKFQRRLGNDCFHSFIKYNFSIFEFRNLIESSSFNVIIFKFLPYFQFFNRTMN